MSLEKHTLPAMAMIVVKSSLIDNCYRTTIYSILRGLKWPQALNPLDILSRDPAEGETRICR